MEHETNKRGREKRRQPRKTAAKKMASAETSHRGRTESIEEPRLARSIPHQEEEKTRPKPRREPERKPSATRVKLPDIRLRAKVEGIVFIPKRPSHSEVSQVIQAKLTKYSYCHPDIRRPNYKRSKPQQNHRPECLQHTGCGGSFQHHKRDERRTLHD